MIVNSPSGGGSFTVNTTPTGLAITNFQPGPAGTGPIAHWNAENGAADVTGADVAKARENVRPSLDPVQVESLRAFSAAR